MFTGLIEDVGTLAGRRRGEAGWKLSIATALPLAQMAVGESVAVNGVCLTVERADPATGSVHFHTLDETLSRTDLGSLPVGAEVNLERAMRAAGRFGGHFVTGHVDAVSAVRAFREIGADWELEVDLPESLRELVVPKGSIAVSGISLTIAALRERSFTVRVIPHTRTATSLRQVRSGDRVNLETDLIGKYVQRQVTAQSVSSVTMETLAGAGFLHN